MKSSKLISLLTTFNDKEFKELEKFLLYKFDGNATLQRFIEFIRLHYPKFEEKKIEKEKVSKFVFPNKKYEDIKVRELMSAAYKNVLEFLVVQESMFHEFKTELALLRQFRRRKVDHLFQQQLKHIKKQINVDVFQNIEFVRREFLIASEENQFFEDQQVRRSDESIQVKLDSLDKYYFSIKLRDTCEMLNRHGILSKKYNLNLLSEMEGVIESNKNDYLSYPPITCFYQIYKLLTTEDNEAQYELTIETLKQNTRWFTNVELKSMFDMPLNYCIRQVNSGVPGFTEILFALQKYLIGEKIMFENGQLSHISVRNVVSIALKLKEFDWSAEFIEEYKDFIAPRYRENAYNLSTANLLYATQKYDDTIALLNHVEFTDVYYACTAKFTLLKAYYELKEYDTLEYFTTSFNLYLKRNKEIPSDFKKSSQNFLKVFKKVLNLATKLDYIETDKALHKKEMIQNILNEERVMTNRNWLKEKIEEFKI